MPRDFAAELREKKRIERETRINNFRNSMDTVDFWDRQPVAKENSKVRYLKLGDLGNQNLKIKAFLSYFIILLFIF